MGYWKHKIHITTNLLQFTAARLTDTIYMDYLIPRDTREGNLRRGMRIDFILGKQSFYKRCLPVGMMNNKLIKDEDLSWNDRRCRKDNILKYNILFFLKFRIFASLQNKTNALLLRALHFFPRKITL